MKTNGCATRHAIKTESYPETPKNVSSNERGLSVKRGRVYLCRAFCAMCGVAILLLGGGACAGAQTASIGPSFEVATIKPVQTDAAHPFDPAHFWAHVSQDRASYWSMTLRSLIAYAYGVQDFQVSSGAGWATTDRFDIEAKFPEGAGKEEEPGMLQALLKDRFRLSFHIEKQELEGYALVQGKQGAKLNPSLPDPPNFDTDALSKAGANPGGNSDAKSKMANSKITRNADGSSTLDMGKRGTQTVKFDQENWATHYELSKMTMEELARRLGSCLGAGGHRVDDQTGITGEYQIAFDCPLGVPRPAGRRDGSDVLPPDPQGGGLLNRSLGALGLKLEKRKIPMDVYVIDHVERPSEN